MAVSRAGSRVPRRSARVSQRARALKWRLANRLMRGFEAPAEPSPSFDIWAQERTARPPRAFDQFWREITEWRDYRPARVAVLLHVFYPELVPELIESIGLIPVPVDIIVTNSSGSTLDLTVRDGDRAIILESANRGRDILPMMEVVNAGLLDPYDLVLKVHTKRSSWRGDHDLPGDGNTWRRELLDAVLGSSDNIAAIMSAFSQDPSLGQVTADDSVLGAQHWGDNQALVQGLLRRIELPLDPSELTFAAGSVYWVRGFVLSGLRCLNLGAKDFPDEAGQVNQTTAHAVERMIGILCHEAGLTVRGRSALSVAQHHTLDRFEPDSQPTPRARAIPFYLPQFHPIPENDAWWGRGFTEWSNVAAGRPLYPGHHQPRLPQGLGFYDLRTPETVAEQCRLARGASLSGFMYYNYWFSGRKLLDRPITDRLSDQNTLPFCVMWANENWTRAWDGSEEDILLAQSHDVMPPGDYIRSVLPVLADPRYIRVDGAALVAVYRAKQLPDPAKTFTQWREIASESGIGELFILCVEGSAEYDEDLPPVSELGSDGTMTFAPHAQDWIPLPSGTMGLHPGVLARVWSYEAMVGGATAEYRRGIPDTHFPGVMVAFDNTCRRSEWPDIWYGANPYTYHRWLSAAIDAVADRPPERRLVFINAWNEWAEAAVLEPSDRFGNTYLLATRSALTN